MRAVRLANPKSITISVPGYVKEKNGGWEYDPARPMWFEPPCDDPIKPVNLGQGYCSGEWLTNVTTYDYLVVPQHLKPGEYVLGFRCENPTCRPRGSHRED